MKVISTLALLSGLAGLALACPDGYFEDCCAEYGPTSPEELRRMTVDESIIPEGVTIAGYVCQGARGCEYYDRTPRCCKSTWKGIQTWISGHITRSGHEGAGFSAVIFELLTMGWLDHKHHYYTGDECQKIESLTEFLGARNTKQR
ncbi:hypothetical protein MBM_09244 [Drepanopeziza brunnea f. sp. 'multigermtubi' MB_m1]|uniref:Uncharacterized protein n=1 Tax=Marssonina brunnea f. sp. multigermtubi (strain MB_m1) TaxID=1072389 RepID=K1W6R7_MARBU|nr:uncharacterized protein MBM_09244 [Drepanopeziza brunnea f. sp. 'multigermtubi' MB_m1]EKD12675.1 hypothetical protein MBM_09244 [Drepanopeziza brunnea f. sp. 'multigermtubi' MB_m1]